MTAAVHVFEFDAWLRVQVDRPDDIGAVARRGAGQPVGDAEAAADGDDDLARRLFDEWFATTCAAARALWGRP